ncbi:hypothetical protein EUTSA_v10017904mg [Eutrema salsugineum]|uniref:Protein kinase domain-containing protein n=1 Tax=Eutrema salsugineum TaxID=72664 RepID=V4M9E0_EUTSA|nr:mitogen-activated protein kinase kinase kinase 17 [Eutrema salsugineum]ESQ52969.1 hypothetical protein EUTSA_v10017904mg [Eutrema salsugineum]
MQPEMEFVKFLGKGSFGSVDLFRHRKPDGSMLYNAVKVSDVQGYDSLYREFKILKKLRGCPRIVQCFADTLFEEFNCHGNKVYKMVMEYASAGTLSAFMARNRTLSDSTIKDFTRMILQGLVSIHSLGYVHCDLKPDNLLLFPRYDEKTWDFSYDLKISDFGMSIKAGEQSDYWSIVSPFVGTPIYMSPESVQDGTVEKALDLWSLGCIVLEMYIGKRPWSGVDSDDLESNLLKNIAPEIPHSLPCDARKFLETCFASKPDERRSASELLMHPFLTGEQMVAAGGERRPLLLKLKIRPRKSTVIPEKPLKTITIKPPQFKKVAVKPQKMKVKIIPPTRTLPASTFETAQ